MAQSRAYRATAVILKRKNTGESDRILTVFSREHGKLRVIAKGVRKAASRRNAHLELFNEAVIMLHKGTSLDVVTQAEAMVTFTDKLVELWQVSAAYYVAELVDALVPDNAENAETYDLLSGVLKDIPATPRERLEERLVGFTRDALAASGFAHPAMPLTRLREIVPYAEGIIERRLKTPKMLWHL